ncbi:uncharacterized protein [Eurosta solidaginis]|uniref:uncharacterized protein n=1 Tax=Eurosta solidaginis TaxID=178769 RepID=UPI003531169B
MHVTSLIFVLLGVLVIRNASGDVRYRGNAVHAEYPGQCYYEELRQPIPKNQSYKPINRDGRCESIYCRKDYVIEIEFCGRHNLQPNETCRIDSDMRRAFPACCPRLVCQTDSNFI